MKKTLIKFFILFSLLLTVTSNASFSTLNLENSIEIYSNFPLKDITTLNLSF